MRPADLRPCWSGHSSISTISIEQMESIVRQAVMAKILITKHNHAAASTDMSQTSGLDDRDMFACTPEHGKEGQSKSNMCERFQDRQTFWRGYKDGLAAVGDRGSTHSYKSSGSLERDALDHRPAVLQTTMDEHGLTIHS